MERDIVDSQGESPYHVTQLPREAAERLLMCALHCICRLQIVPVSCESTSNAHPSLHPQLMMVSRMRDALDEASCLGCCLGLESMRAAPDGLYVVVANRTSVIVHQTLATVFRDAHSLVRSSKTSRVYCLPSTHATFTCLSRLNT
jgi:hypothetical protein